ncbi:MAG TPA: glutathione S-transferase N-terminal domain-containing protein [Sphingomicrobium sp.]|jgi:glutathione S-transferase|nr:glutathione S-transferase N-terminal domain-containing protein [Sphingomicrobium sp.]
MILYYSPGACSLVAHIALEEAGAKFTAQRVVLAEGAHRTAEYLKINPHARVPALEVDDRIITENVAILNYLALRFGAVGSVPLEVPLASARTNELLGWFASTVHIAFAQIWRPERFTADTDVHPAIVAGGHGGLRGHFAEIEGFLGTGWAVEGHFTAADSYLLTFFRWGRRIGHDMSAYPRWAALVERIIARPAVERALATEELAAEAFLEAA